MHLITDRFAGLAANDNFTSVELPTAIPPEKAKARVELAAAIEGHPVTVCEPFTAHTSIEPWQPGPIANDNTPQSWPLAEALRRANRETDIEVCEVYRGLWSIMASDPMQGRHPNMAEDEEPAIHSENRATLDGKEVFDKTGEVTGTGEI